MQHYALKVNGKIVTPPLTDRMTVEQYRSALPAEQKALAEVVLVTAQGSELLLG